jgi:hypothetical protein
VKRAAVVLAALALAGCGDGDKKKPRPGPRPTAVGGKLDQADKALKELKDSDLPEDARRELEEAKRLLDEARRAEP